MFAIRGMREADAKAIAAWHYPGPYAFYDWTQDPDDLAELLDPAEWGERYFAADSGGELAGFFVFKRAGDVLDLGLGLRPDLTGQGLGASFLDAGLQYAAEHFGARHFTLAVAAFNHRAITVYGRAGFTETKRYRHRTNGADHDFVAMAR